MVEIDGRAGALWGLARGDAGEVGPALAVWDATAVPRPAAPDSADALERYASAVADHLLSWDAASADAGEGRDVAQGPRSAADAHRPSLRALARNGDPAAWPRLAAPECAAVTVVRAAWLGVHPSVRPEHLAALAQTQALVTDAHPVAPVAAETAAALTRALARGQAVPGRAAAWVRSYVAEARVRTANPLLLRIAGDPGAARHLDAGWAALTPQVCPGPDGGAEATGDADRALATALRRLDAAGESPAALGAARGERPGTAALLGAFLGAARGPVLGVDTRLAPADHEALVLRAAGDAPRRFASARRPLSVPAP